MAFEKKRKVCNFCMDNIHNVDYKEAFKLKRYMTDRGKILPRRITGTCAKHQRLLTRSIKMGRQVGILPFLASEIAG